MIHLSIPLLNYKETTPVESTFLSKNCVGCISHIEKANVYTYIAKIL